MNCEDFGSLDHLLSVTSKVLEFVRAMKKTIERGSASVRPKFPTAELLWIREVQRQLVEDKLFPTWEKQFLLFRDGDGVWRCGGRLHQAALPEFTKHPVLLPRDQHLTFLIVRRSHEKVYHNGTRETLAEVRSKFWIVKGRSLVRKVIQRCTVCRRYEGLHYEVPPPPPLPDYRIRQHPPFSNVGVDFAGPLYVRYPGSENSNKVWLCLFTCCVVRAVHLDLVPDMTTSTFLRCLKRFTARRGVPRRMVSDNGKTFKSAVKTLCALVKQPEVRQYLSGNCIQWTFNIERAPWWGGMFERLIKSTKRCLRKSIGRSKLQYDELITILIEIESMINSRPLTYISPDDLEEPLSPSHFLCGRRVLSLPDGLDQEDIENEYHVSQPVLSKRLKHLNFTLNSFWKRWQKEYLLELRETHRYHRGREDATPPSVGDIVLIEDKDKPRGLWRLAKINSLVIGKDGRPRGAVLRVSSSNGRTGILQRPIQRLYPLEASLQPTQGPPPQNLMQGQPSGNVVAPIHSEPQMLRPQRAAAANAKDRITAVSILENDSDPEP